MTVHAKDILTPLVKRLDNAEYSLDAQNVIHIRFVRKSVSGLNRLLCAIET